LYVIVTVSTCSPPRTSYVVALRVIVPVVPEAMLPLMATDELGRGGSVVPAGSVMSCSGLLRSGTPFVAG